MLPLLPAPPLGLRESLSPRITGQLPYRSLRRFSAERAAFVVKLQPSALPHLRRGWGGCMGAFLAYRALPGDGKLAEGI